MMQWRTCCKRGTAVSRHSCELDTAKVAPPGNEQVEAPSSPAAAAACRTRPLDATRSERTCASALHVLA